MILPQVWFLFQFVLGQTLFWLTHLPTVREWETQRLSLTTGDTNDSKYLGFHSVKPRKVRGRSSSPEGRAVLHQAADKSFVWGQELRFAKEGLCMMLDAQSATGSFPGKITADRETQKLDLKDFKLLGLLPILCQVQTLGQLMNSLWQNESKWVRWKKKL